MTLSEKNIDFIQKDLRKRGLKYKKLRQELLDHICCTVEQNISEKKIAFEVAYQSALRDFGENGLQNTELETLAFVKSYRKQITPMSAIMTFAIACILVFVVFINIDTKAQVRPEIMPVKDAETITADTHGKQERFRFLEEDISLKDESKFKSGIKFHVPRGTAILATAKGEVLEVGKDNIILKHDEAYQTLYSKLSNFAVRKGERVEKGQVIAYAAGYEDIYGERYISYQVFKDGKARNPFLYFE